MATLLEIDDLRLARAGRPGDTPVRLVDGVSFAVEEGEAVALVGESGCGKSLSALAVLGLLPKPGVELVGGSIRWRGRELAVASANDLRRVRGAEIGMVFQEPMAALNPVYRIGAQLAEALTAHDELDEALVRERSLTLLAHVGMPEPALQLGQFPHQLSGGMRQRVLVAIALAQAPSLLIADEPTTALDVTVQAQILRLLMREQRERGLALLLITHDLAVVAGTCMRVIVMYGGRIAEQGPTVAVLGAPLHPYTQGLLGAMPQRARPGERLAAIPGGVPAPEDFVAGCRFRDRCARASTACERVPSLVPAGGGRTVACHHPLVASAPGSGGAQP